jgi:hypothetical protein
MSSLTDPAQLGVRAAEFGEAVPLIIYIHGGAGPAAIRSCPLLFVKDGYAAASLEYRFANKAVPRAIQTARRPFASWRQRQSTTSTWTISAWVANRLCLALIGTSGGTHAFAPIGGYLDQSDRASGVRLFGPANFMTVIQQGNANAEKHLPKWGSGGSRGYRC